MVDDIKTVGGRKKRITKQWLWLVAIWIASVSCLSMFAYLLRFIIG